MTVKALHWHLKAAEKQRILDDYRKAGRPPVLRAGQQQSGDIDINAYLQNANALKTPAENFNPFLYSEIYRAPDWE